MSADGAQGKNGTGTRIERRFAELQAAKRAALVTFVTAGDPDYDLSLDLVKRLPEAGADLIELGMPFTDPMADGPAIQASSLRALKNGMTLRKTLKLVREFRAGNQATPIILMGYYNPIYSYGVEPFLRDAPQALWPGFIVIEDSRQRWQTDLAGLLERNGYRLVAQTRLNLVFERKPA